MPTHRQQRQRTAGMEPARYWSCDLQCMEQHRARRSAGSSPPRRWPSRRQARRQQVADVGDERVERHAQRVFHAAARPCGRPLARAVVTYCFCSSSSRLARRRRIMPPCRRCRSRPPARSCARPGSSRTCRATTARRCSFSSIRPPIETAEPRFIGEDRAGSVASRKFGRREAEVAEEGDRRGRPSCTGASRSRRRSGRHDVDEDHDGGEGHARPTATCRSPTTSSTGLADIRRTSRGRPAAGRRSRPARATTPSQTPGTAPSMRLGRARAPCAGRRASRPPRTSPCALQLGRAGSTGSRPAAAG
jgi:hypothetical protein